MKSKLLIYFLPVLLVSFLIYGYSSQDNPFSDVDNLDTKIQQQVNEMTSKSPPFLTPGMQTDNLAPVPDTIIYKGPIPAYPSGVFGHASNWLGDTLYVCGGSLTGTASTNVYTYSITSDIWSTGVSMPVAKTGGSLVRAGNALYYIGGGSTLSGTTATANTLRYRVGLGWDEVAPIPTPVVGNATACWGDSVIYCLLGGWSQYYRGTQIYRPSSDTWSRASDSLPAGAGRRSLAGGIVGNKLYVACGFSGAFRKDMYIGTIGADGNTITWASGPAVPCRGLGMSRPGGTGFDGHFYVIGAETSPAPAIQDSIFIFNTNTNTWLTPLSGRGTGAASNYWGAISAKDVEGKTTVFIPGGIIAGTTTFGLYVATSRSGPPGVCTNNWTTQTSGTTGQLLTVSTVSDQIGWAAGSGPTVIKTVNGGATWTSATGTGILGDIYNIYGLDANTALCTTTPGATFIYKTINGGTTWTQVYTLAGGFIDGIQMISATEGYALGDPVASKWTVLKTTNGGDSWARMATEPNQVGGEAGWNNSFQALGTHLWFGTNQTRVYHSSDLGLTWASGVTTGTANTYCVHYNTSSNGIAGGNAMVKSIDGGATYTATGSPGTGGNINGAEGAGTDWWALRNDANIYRSTNQGANWTTAHTATGAVFQDIDFKVVDGCPVGWAVSSTGTVAYMRTITGISNYNSEVPSSYLLKQNFPNPFNPTTNVNFSIPKSGLVTLKIYDILGKEIATLVNEFKNAGNYEIIFNGANFSSGVYFYRIESGNFIDTKKMYLLK